MNATIETQTPAIAVGMAVQWISVTPDKDGVDYRVAHGPVEAINDRIAVVHVGRSKRVSIALQKLSLRKA